MNERENRKVLISFKVSTLLIVILGIIFLSIILAVVINFVSNKDTEKVSSNNLNGYEKRQTETIKNMDKNSNPTVSSRSISTRNDEYIDFQEEFVNQQIENTNEENLVEENAIETTKIEDVLISKDMDLTVRTGLSRDDFILLISRIEKDTSNFFEENAGLIYDLCEKYSINEVFFCGLIAAESGWNISSGQRNSNNFISLMSKKGLIKYSTVEEGLEKALETLHYNYLTPGGKFYNGSTLQGMKTKFCPASSTWIDLVYNQMKIILK